VPAGQQKPFGCGAVGALFVVVAVAPVKALRALTGAVDIADASRKIPPSAILLSMVSPCGLVWPPTAGP